MDLRTIFERKPDLLLAKERVRSVLNDIYHNDLSKVNVMMAAYSIDIINMLRSNYPISQFDKIRLVKILVQQHSLVEEKANWAVDTWVSCVSAAVIRGMDAANKLSREETDKTKKEASENAAKKAAEKQEKLERRTQNMLLTREDYDSYYVNPLLDENLERIYVPCGVGNTDNGFFIYGITKSLLCNHPAADVYSLIYNYLVRNSKIIDDNLPHYIRNLKVQYRIDYRSVFRLAIVLLQMIRHNHITGFSAELSLPSKEERENINYAVGLIDHYASLFSRLIKRQPVKLQVKLCVRGQNISLNARTGIYAVNNSEIVSNARELWYGRKINYRLTMDDLHDMEYILSEISPFDSFKEGQYSALCGMLGTNKHAVCIMPTGSGKSLIYYLASLLQPLPLFVVAPTEILIEDQIRNLRKFHQMDNVAHLMLTDENSFRDYEIRNSLNFVTPMTLQNRHLLVMFRYINNGTKQIDMLIKRIAPIASASYIVLDEIHCLSNWGHDFRPEYLMLSRYLNKFLDQVSFWGFTATANFTVVEDIQRQLLIPRENFFSPISFDKYNVSYNFRPLHSTEDMYLELGEISRLLIAGNQRTLIFTKSDGISHKVAEVIGYDADIFSTDSPAAYHHFADGKCKMLITSEELGVGINLPNIRNIIHFGLPLSKNEYIQEIGRAGRSNEQVTSYVLYLENVPSNVPIQLLRRDTSMDEIPPLLEGVRNDYGDIYRRLTNNSPTKDVLSERLINLQKEFETEIKGLTVRGFKYDHLDETKQLLYMLYTAGYVNDWYSYCKSAAGDGVDILIDIASADYTSYKTDPGKMLNRMKTRLRDYFELMGNDREVIAKTNRSESTEEVTRIYVNWYYTKYLYHHNEQFLDLYDFIKDNGDCNSEKITGLIKDFFVLPFQRLMSDETYYGEMSLKNAINKAVTGMNHSDLANIERINSNRYSYKLDCLLLYGYLRYNGILDESRLERLLSRTPLGEQQDIRQGFLKLYGVCGLLERLLILKYIQKPGNLLSINIDIFLRAAYFNAEKDLIFYSILARKLNHYFI